MNSTFDEDTFLKYYDRQIYPLTVKNILKLVAYAPIGITLILIRLIIISFLFVLFSLFPCFNRNLNIVRFTSITLGIHTCLAAKQQANEEQQPAGTDALKIYVSNHLTGFDYVAIKSIEPFASYFVNSSRHHQSSMRINRGGKMAELLASLLKNLLTDTPVKENGVGGGGDDDESVTENVNNYPFICFPEVISTNGKYGLLKFDRAVFDIEVNKSSSVGDGGRQTAENNRIAIVPVCLSARRPLLPFSINCFKSNDLIDALVTLFTPITVYEISLLRAQYKSPNESVEQFSDRVEQLIASHLKLNRSNLTHDDFRAMYEAYKRRQRILLNRRASSRNVNNNDGNGSTLRRTNTVDKLALQIKDILPNVSYKTIQEHIARSSTVDIDTVIASILDSNQEEDDTTTTASNVINSRSDPSSPSTSNNVSSTPSSKNSTDIPVASKKSPHIHLSYDERKFNLINEARKRFVAKNPQFTNKL